MTEQISIKLEFTLSLIIRCNTIKDLFTLGTACTGTEFECSNGNCIPVEYVNDTVNDCGDNSEEGIFVFKLFLTLDIHEWGFFF